MFVSGGFWDMASVESYDMRTEKPDWEMSMKPMNWSRSSHALVYLDGESMKTVCFKSNKSDKFPDPVVYGLK